MNRYDMNNSIGSLFANAFRRYHEARPWSAKQSRQQGSRRGVVVDYGRNVLTVNSMIEAIVDTAMPITVDK